MYYGSKAGFAKVNSYLTKQRHILLEEGYVKEHRKVVEECELRKKKQEQ